VTPLALRTARSTVYWALKRWIGEGLAGPDDRPNAGGGVWKADLKVYAAVRRIQENPGLGAFRVRAALPRRGARGAEGGAPPAGGRRPGVLRRTLHARAGPSGLRCLAALEGLRRGGLAGRQAALWLRERTLTLEHAGEPLSRYAVEFSSGTQKPRAIARAVLFGTAIPLPQPRLFRLESLGEGGWLKALRLEDYAPRRSKPGSLQQALFPYHEAWG
jgi:hypothetical protein